MRLALVGLICIIAAPAGAGRDTAQPSTTAAIRGGTPIALVTAETENELLAVDLDSGKIVQRLQLPAQPENVDVRPVGTFVAVSTRAGAVTLMTLGR
jgi:hypothetical protein